MIGAHYFQEVIQIIKFDTVPLPKILQKIKNIFIPYSIRPPIIFPPILAWMIYLVKSIRENNGNEISLVNHLTTIGNIIVLSVFAHGQFMSHTHRK